MSGSLGVVLLAASFVEDTGFMGVSLLLEASPSRQTVRAARLPVCAR